MATKSNTLHCGVSKEEFYNIFKALSKSEVHKLWWLLTTKPCNMKDLVKNYLPSKLWRLNNMYYITDKWSNRIKFRMNRAQFIVYSKLLIHPRLIILKSRQQGISTLFLIHFFDSAITRKDRNCGLMAQDAPAASALLERTRNALNDLHPNYKNIFGVGLTRDNTGQLTFKNRSNLYIKTSFRSATLQMLHISELGKIAKTDPQKAKETITGSLQALAPGNIGVIESTAEGKNMFFDFWTKAVAGYEEGKPLASKEFMPVFLPWTNDPDCIESTEMPENEAAADYFKNLSEVSGTTLSLPQKNFWIMQHKELDESIHQEYPATPEEAFKAPKDGTYWAGSFQKDIINKGHIKEDLFEPNLDLYVALDLGTAYTSLGMFQFFNGQLRIVDEYWNVNKTMDHYAEYIKKYPHKLKIILPHDAIVKDYSAPQDMNRQQLLRHNHGLNTVILPKASVAAGIQGVRDWFPDLYIDRKCKYLIDCFTNYSKKWDERNQMWLDEPTKSEFNHGADTIRYICYYTTKHLKNPVKQANIPEFAI